MATQTSSGFSWPSPDPGPVLVIRLWTGRWLVFVGGFSYNLYLVHAPLLQVGRKYLVAPFSRNGGAQVTLMLLVLATLTIAVAWGFYWLFERPFMSPWREQATSAPVQSKALPSAP